MSECLNFRMHSGGSMALRDTDNEARPLVVIAPRNSVLRRALRSNIISFPSQVPVLSRQSTSDIQWRAVHLYFLQGWAVSAISIRFRIPIHRIWRLLNEWVVRALAFGYIQIIDAEDFAKCCGMPPNSEEDSAEVQEIAPAVRRVRQRQRAGHPATHQVVKPPQDLIAALDAAIAHCQGRQDDLNLRALSLLRELKSATVTAINLPSATGWELHIPKAPHSAAGGVRRGKNGRHEEGQR
jgi:hypothetical protein